jgi:hypothetical protein
VDLMSGINWGILGNAPDAGQAFTVGLEQGRQHRREMQTQNALAAYAQNPDDPNAAHSLLAVDPRLGMTLMQDQRERQQHNELQQIRQRAASGDHEAVSELFARDPESWGKLDAQTREHVKQATSFMGNAVLEISRLPEAARPQAWAHYVQQAEAGGLDIPTHYEQYSPEAMNAAAAEAGTMEKVIKQFEPDYVAVVPGGRLVNKNPMTPGFSSDAATAIVPQEGFDALPPGYAPAGGAGSDPRHFP